jgi:hypothetical protein
MLPTRTDTGRRRKTRLESYLPLAAIVAVLVGLSGGYAWYSFKQRVKSEAATATDQVADPAARMAALDLMDEAIRAKFEKRASGALSAIDRARRADPFVPGLDVAFAELALNEKQFIEMRVAAGAARKKNDHAAGAAVLLGIDKWLSRSASDRDMSAAADAASAYFAEATEDDFFAAPAWFFWGDVLRYAGREAQGRDRALSALYRFNPWDSADLLTAKAILASVEAGDSVFGGLTFLPDSPWAQAVGEVAIGQKSGTGTPWGTLLPYAAQQTFRALAGDPLLLGFAEVGIISGQWPASGFPLLP